MTEGKDRISSQFPHPQSASIQGGKNTEGTSSHARAPRKMETDPQVKKEGNYGAGEETALSRLLF